MLRCERWRLKYCGGNDGNFPYLILQPISFTLKHLDIVFTLLVLFEQSRILVSVFVSLYKENINHRKENISFFP